MNSNDVVYVPQNEIGFIVKNKTCPTKIGTFGCGPCVALGVFIPGVFASVAHFSKPIIAKRTNGIMNYWTSKILSDKNFFNTPVQVYLIGGYKGKSEKIVKSILSMLEKCDFNIEIINKSCLTYYGSKSLSIDIDGNIGEYYPYGKEQIDEYQAVHSNMVKIAFLPFGGACYKKNVMKHTNKYSGDKYFGEIKGFNFYSNKEICLEAVKLPIKYHGNKYFGKYDKRRVEKAKRRFEKKRMLQKINLKKYPCYKMKRRIKFIYQKRNYN
jgi:hypothetical protein